MKRRNHIFVISLSSVLSLPLLLSSCAQEDMPDSRFLTDGDIISFTATLPEATTRSTYDVNDSLLANGFMVSALCPESAEADSRIPVHFENQNVSRWSDGIFRSDSCKWSSNKSDKKNGYLKFFAFHPSIAEMKSRSGAGNDCFIFTNASTKGTSGNSYDYRLTKFRMIPDISKQVDFVAAIGEGNKTTDLYRDIEIRFEHQFAGVDINVWGGSTLYDVEVAGVRIGGTIVEADFNLSTEIANPDGNDNTLGSWVITDKAKYGYVDYVYSEGDKVIEISQNSHNTSDKAVSIMGNGGKAMVIPYKHLKWDHRNDRKNTANGLYFSVLIRMYQHDGDHHFIFPSTDPATKKSLVYLLVRKSDGTVMKRLTENEYDNYVAPEGMEKRAYGWAAVPAFAEWKPGYNYSYTLDYTNGVGVHDPSDPLNEASTILDWDGVELTYTKQTWGDGEVITVGSGGGWGANSNDTAEDGTVWWK